MTVGLCPLPPLFRTAAHPLFLEKTACNSAVQHPLQALTIRLGSVGERAAARTRACASPTRIQTGNNAVSYPPPTRAASRKAPRSLQSCVAVRMPMSSEAD